MPSIFPCIEGDAGSSLTRDFSGNMLSQHYEELIAIADKLGVRSLNDFMYLDEDMLAEFDIELPEEQLEWHSPQEGILALSATLSHPDLPDDPALKGEMEDLILILTKLASSSGGWRLQQDI